MVIISKNVTLCKSLWRKSTGLMFTKQQTDFAYIFPFAILQRIRITMWWVFYSIDIIFLDQDNQIVELVSNLRPFSFYASSHKAKTFIELPVGTIKKQSLMKGMTCSWDKKTFFSK